MAETIVVEAVSDKFKNKYNNGSVLAGGKWLQVSSKVDLGLFKKDTQITVNTKTNDKGYTSIIGVVDAPAAEPIAETVEAPKKVIHAPRIESPEIKVSYEDAKSKRILVQGLTQAVLQAPFLAGLPFTNKEEAVALVKAITIELVDFVNDQAK